MLQEAIIEHGSPTLAGIKTGSLFRVACPFQDIADEVRGLNGMLRKYGLRIIPVRKRKKTTLMYLYRPSRLKADLSCPEAKEILMEKGYSYTETQRCIAQLSRHLKEDAAFPHEVGLFLGYPPSDVKCFMESPFEGVRCIGCWKAYSNEDAARATFEKYKKCTTFYRKEIGRGKPLEALIVNAG